MAFAYYPQTPGTEAGPCLESCAHTDCAKQRKDAEQLCPGCCTPIGYGNAVTTFHLDDRLWLVHARCITERGALMFRVDLDPVPSPTVNYDLLDWLSNESIAVEATSTFCWLVAYDRIDHTAHIRRMNYADVVTLFNKKYVQEHFNRETGILSYTITIAGYRELITHYRDDQLGQSMLEGR